MSKVVMHNVVSVDGFIADAQDQVGPLFDWYSNGDTAVLEGSPAKVSKASADYIGPMYASIGSMVVGRHVFDLTNGWEGTPPAGEHMVVVSHRPRPDGWYPTRRTTLSTVWCKRSRRPRNSRARGAPSPSRRATSAGRRSPSVWWRLGRRGNRAAALPASFPGLHRPARLFP